jgi:type IV pilus assembly protein PilC
MPRFRYLARNRAGQQQIGVLEAASRDALVAGLRTQGLLVLECNEEVTGPDPLTRLNPFEYRRIDSIDVEESFHQIAVMLKSGLTLLAALEIVAEYSRIAVRRVWVEIMERIRAGGTLSEAMSRYPVFTPLSIQMVRVGEQTGLLDVSLRQISTEMEEARKLRAQILAAMTYPAVTLLATIGVVVFLMVKLIPELKKFLSLMGKRLPPITQALVDVSNWCEHYALGIAIGVATTVAIVVAVYQIPPCRYYMDAMALRLPVVGRVLRLSATVTFARALGTLLRSGVLIVDALETVAGLHGNRYLGDAVRATRRRVMAGSSLAEPLGAIRGGYMPMLYRMVVVGENSGTLDLLLQEVTDYHQELLQKLIQRLSALITPVMTIVVGGILGFVYAAFLVAMFAAGGGGGGHK